MTKPDNNPQNRSLFSLLPPQERERCERASEHLKERLSSDPFHAERAKEDPLYYQEYYASAIKS